MSDRPRVLYYKILSYQPENIELLSKEFDVIQLNTPADDSDSVLAHLDGCFAPLGYKFDLAKFKRCPNLRVVISNTTGVPHIDMQNAEARNVKVFSLRDEQSFLDTITPTAEHAFGLMLALLRRTPWSYNAVLAGGWNRFEFGGPAMLSRLSLGIVGMGRLGKKLANYAAAFGMKVYYFDPYIENIPDGFVRKDALKDLLSLSDIVSIHVPANASTYHLFDTDAFSWMKRESILINTARGEIVDESALLHALKGRVLAGAALDVLDGEYEPGFEVKAHPLVNYAQTHDNLLITPHVGGSTIDAWRETQRRVIDMAVEFFAEDRG